ncbi:TPA: hypothetical protein PRU78_004443 [Escherichia coli]|nr:hypothetical protein [Escherichia coli]
MHSQLRERIRLMRARLDNAAPVAEIRAESQLFVTPAPVCDRLVTLAEISNRDHILEPALLQIVGGDKLIIPFC